MTNKEFIRLQRYFIRIYQYCHPSQSRDMSAMVFIKRYSQLLRISFNLILKHINNKKKHFSSFYVIDSSNGEKVIFNITYVKYIIERNNELKIVFDDEELLIVKGKDHYKEFIENFE